MATYREYAKKEGLSLALNRLNPNSQKYFREGHACAIEKIGIFEIRHAQNYELRFILDTILSRTNSRAIDDTIFGNMTLSLGLLHAHWYS